MFCGNCGVQMDDNATVCGYCGATLENGSSDGTQSFKVIDPEKKKRVKKYITVGVSVVAVIVVICVLTSVILNFTGYKGCLRKTMNALEKSDTIAFTKIATGIIEELETDDADEYIESYIEENVDAIKEKIENKVGHNYKFSYKVDEYFALEGRKFDNIIDRIEEYDDISISIDKIEVAEVTITAKKGKKVYDMQIQIVMSKENGSWKLLSIIPYERY